MKERVTAKSKPMMNVGVTIQREGSERTCFDCIGKPGEKTKSESQKRTSELVKGAANKHGKTRIGRQLIKLLRMEQCDKWSSQLWKSDQMLGTSTGRPVDDKFVIDDDMDSDTEAESEMSLESRSFLNRGE